MRSMMGRSAAGSHYRRADSSGSRRQPRNISPLELSEPNFPGSKTVYGCGLRWELTTIGTTSRSLSSQRWSRFSVGPSDRGWGAHGSTHGCACDGQRGVVGSESHRAHRPKEPDDRAGCCLGPSLSCAPAMRTDQARPMRPHLLLRSLGAARHNAAAADRPACGRRAGVIPVTGKKTKFWFGTQHHGWGTATGLTDTLSDARGRRAKNRAAPATMCRMR